MMADFLDRGSEGNVSLEIRKEVRSTEIQNSGTPETNEFFIHLSSKYLLNACSMSGIVLCTGDIAVYKKTSCSFPPPKKTLLLQILHFRGK